MPQKTSKKGKKKKEEEAHELTEEEKAALYSVPVRKGQMAKSEGVSTVYYSVVYCVCCSVCPWSCYCSILSLSSLSCH